MESGNKAPGAEASQRPHPGNAPRHDTSQMTDNLKQQSEAFRSESRQASEQFKGSVSEVTQQAKAKAGEAAERAQRKAGDYARQAQVKGSEMFEQQKQRAVEQVLTVSDAVRRAADKFREEKDDNIAEYIDAAAEQVQRVGIYLDQRNLSSLWRDAQSLGRKRPELFLGGMFVAGLALTRFLKASAERDESGANKQYGASERRSEYSHTGRDESAIYGDTGTTFPGNRLSEAIPLSETSEGGHATGESASHSSGTRSAGSPGGTSTPLSASASTAPGMSIAPAPSPYANPDPSPAIAVPTIYPATAPIPSQKEVL